MIPDQTLLQGSGKKNSFRSKNGKHTHRGDNFFIQKDSQVSAQDSKTDRALLMEQKRQHDVPEDKVVDALITTFSLVSVPEQRDPKDDGHSLIHQSVDLLSGDEFLDHHQSTTDDMVRQAASSDDMDEIEAVRIKLEDEDNKDMFLGAGGGGGIEMLTEGTHERCEQEEFQLQTATTYFEKGLHYWTKSDLSKALQEFSRSLEIREDVCGRKDMETAKCYLWVGTIHFLQKEWERSLDEFCRCFRIQYELTDQNFEACHVITNWINKTLEAAGATETDDKTLFWKKFMACIEAEYKGDLLRDETKYEQAIENYRTAVQFEYHRRKLSPTTPGRPLADCGDIFYKIGRCYQIHRKFERAVMEYRQALGVYMAKFGLHHRHTVITMEHMVDMIWEMGFRISVAEEYVASIPTSIRHEQHGDWMLDTQKDPEGALKEYEAALQVEGSPVGKTQVACAMLYYKIGKVYNKLKIPQQAVWYFCRAVGIFESTLGPQHKYSVTTLKLLRESIKATTPV